MERPSATFCSGKYSALNDFCSAEFLTYCTFESKSSKTVEYQPDKLDDSLIENNHDELMISRESMQCRKVKQICQYYVPNKLLSPEKFAYHLLLLFYMFRGENECIRFSIIVSKQTTRTSSTGCFKLKQNKVLTIWWISWLGFSSI